MSDSGNPSVSYGSDKTPPKRKKIYIYGTPSVLKSSDIFGNSTGFWRNTLVFSPNY